MTDYTYSDISKMIDHALLSPTQTDAEMEAGCKLAALYDVASVCVKPAWVRNASDWLAGGKVMVGTVIGFPHGGHHKAVKLAEANQALADGADELDMVVNIGKVLSGEWGYVAEEISDVAQAVIADEGCLKVIFETCYLQESHKRELCRICSEVGVHFVKTSTGFGPAGAVTEDLKLMRECSPPPMQVKASGGVRDLDRVLGIRALGVTRVGTSATAAILDEARKRLNLPPLTAPEGATPAGQKY